ncbi:hypothetical protein GQ42DRAFT_118956 [Ramicandelaber brevisporus]|nr:hypothetical protein GQ42DRAFT_118956 [Ramicandelaber brevisporus]
MRTRNTPKITLALDLDETLVHCSVEELPDADHVFTVPFGPDVYTIWCRIRPHMAEFLERVSSKFELVLFTASHPNYAVKALEIIDPRNRIFRHRLYRTSCVYYQNNYIKDLTVLDRKLAHVALVDNSPHAYSFHPVNGVPIRTWYDDPFDEELLKVADFLDTIADVEDVRPHIDKFFKTRTRMFESSRFPAF